LQFKRLKRLRDRENYLRDAKKIEPDTAMVRTGIYNSMGYTIFSRQGFLPVKDLPVPDTGTIYLSGNPYSLQSALVLY